METYSKLAGVLKGKELLRTVQKLFTMRILHIKKTYGVQPYL